AGLGALWWAIHPLRAEPVAWVTGRIYTQCCLFLVSCFVTYLYANEARLKPGLRRGLYWTSVCCFVCSLLSYAIVVGAAVVICLLDIYPLRRLPAGPERTWWKRAAWRVYLEKVPYFVVALAVGLMTIWARVNVKGLWNPPPTLAQFGLYPRLMQAFYSWAYYAAIPWRPFHLAPVYTQLVKFNPNGTIFWISALVIVTVSLTVWRFHKRVPGLTVMWLYHLVMLVPLLGLTERPHYVNDRYGHMQGLVVAVGLAGLLAGLWRRYGTKHLVFLAGLAAEVMIILLGFLLCSVQVTIWKNSETLFDHMIAELGDDPYRSDIYWRLGSYRLQQRQYAGAAEAADQTLALVPNHPKALDVKIAALQGMHDNPTLEGVLRTAILRQPKVEWFVLLNEVILEQGRGDEAIENLEGALQRSPEVIPFRLLLAHILLQQHQPEAAGGQLRRILTQEPQNAQARKMLDSLTGPATLPAIP
ncbi:MAG: tetratricopeptide repeat protein, partial [Phycisphaerae bacterium]